MANTSARMLRLPSLPQTHRHWPGGELADRLGISPRTLRRDIERLRDLGHPVDANRGVAGGYQLRSGAAMPPLLLDDEEAIAIAAGLHGAADGAAAGIEETSLRALAKAIQVMPPRLRRRVDALHTYTQPAAPDPGPTADATALMAIAQTCRDSERLRFSYTSRTKEQTTRLVEPHRLVSMGHRWYLVASDQEHMASAEERERQRPHWQQVLNQVATALDRGRAQRPDQKGPAAHRTDHHVHRRT